MLTGEGVRDGGGAKSYDGEEAWSSLNHYILFIKVNRYGNKESQDRKKNKRRKKRKGKIGDWIERAVSVIMMSIFGLLYRICQHLLVTYVLLILFNKFCKF